MSVFRSGFVALVGRPNVGKSTLLNALLGQKLSIVTPRPQTTRHRVIGIVESPEGQIAFVDTPGLHQGHQRALNRAMNRTATSVLADCDLAVLLVEALRWTDEDDLALQRVREAGHPVICVVNKIDRVFPREQLLPYMEQQPLHDLGLGKTQTEKKALFSQRSQMPLPSFNCPSRESASR